MAVFLPAAISFVYLFYTGESEAPGRPVLSVRRLRSEFRKTNGPMRSCAAPSPSTFWPCDDEWTIMELHPGLRTAAMRLHHPGRYVIGGARACVVAAAGQGHV